MVYVNVPGGKKMNTKSPIDMDPGAAIGGRLEMGTTKHVEIEDRDDEKFQVTPSITTAERIKPAEICHGACSASICPARPCIKTREHTGSCYCRLHIP